jgi:5'-deoxynucleotidase YfbR-like HD superfamily hydrolase
MNKLFQFFDRSYTLASTLRYSMVPAIKPENVATHSYFVALHVLLMSEVYEFDVDKAIKIALCHDLTEMEISDVNHFVKKMYPAVANALKDAEAQIIEKFPDSVRDYCTLYNDKSPESMIVHYADAAQCLQMAESEIKLGNHNYFSDVKKNSIIRMEFLTDELKPYVKSK